MKRRVIRLVVFVNMVVFAMMPGESSAGSLDSPGAPADGSGMPTLTGIHEQLNTGVEATVNDSFREPASGPTAGTGKSLNDIKNALPEQDNTNGAEPGDVLSGKTFWGVSGSSWGPQTGSMPTRTLSEANDTVPEGYYQATNLGLVDTDLKSWNIKSGKTIFGVAGSPNVVMTTSGDAVASDILSGKKAWVDGSEVTGSIPTRTLTEANDTVPEGFYQETTLSSVDADLAAENIKSGISIFGVDGGLIPTNDSDLGTCTGTLINIRWCDNGDGTITDRFHNLIWLKNANCFGNIRMSERNLWQLGSVDVCGVTGEAINKQWKTPELKEISTLTGLIYDLTTLPDEITINIQSSYWSNTDMGTCMDEDDHLYFVNLETGEIDYVDYDTNSTIEKGLWPCTYD